MHWVDYICTLTSLRSIVSLCAIYFVIASSIVKCQMSQDNNNNGVSMPNSISKNMMIVELEDVDEEFPEDEYRNAIPRHDNMQQLTAPANSRKRYLVSRRLLQRTLLNRRHVLSDLLDSSHRRRNANELPPAYEDTIPDDGDMTDMDDKKELLAALIAKHRLNTQRTNSPLTTRLPHSTLSTVPIRLCGLSRSC